MLQKIMKDAVNETAKKIASSNNTFTTLELKLELRKNYPDIYWDQLRVSTIMNSLANEGIYNFIDNGTFRVYSLAKLSGTILNSNSITLTNKKQKTTEMTKRISRKTALSLMEKSKGQFFTVEFVKQDGQTRVLNGQYMKDQKRKNSNLIIVKESGKLKAGENAIRNVNLDTLKKIRIGGQNYSIRN